jgi:hypothetical protein
MQQQRPQVKSKRGVVSVTFAVIGVSLIWYLWTRLFLGVRAHFFPQDAFLANGTRLGNILMHVAPLFPSLGVGLLLANFGEWAFYKAASLEGPNLPIGQTSLKEVNLQLLWFTLVVALLTTPLAILGATHYFYLTSGGIVYRTSILTSERHYLWSDVARVETACWFSTQGREQDTYGLMLRDGTRIEILETRSDFLDAYPHLSAALAGNSYEFNHRAVKQRCEVSVSPMWKRILTLPPSETSKTNEDHLLP